MESHEIIRNQLENKAGELSHEELVLLVSQLSGLTQTLLNRVVTHDDDCASCIIRITEIAMTLSRHIDHGHEINYEEPATEQPEEVHEEAENLPYAIINSKLIDKEQTLKIMKITEEFEVIDTFKTFHEARDAVETLNDVNACVVRIDWDKGEYVAALVRYPE